MKTKILIAEDEQKIARSIQEGLLAEGLDSEIASDGQIAEQLIQSHHYQAIILDINLPYKSGVELCSLSRKRDKEVPILMLTAFGEIENKLEAFSMGADDFIVKPFHMRELVARIKVFLKRTSNEGNQMLHFGELKMDLGTKSVYRGQVPINLSAREFSLLKLLIEARGKVVSKSEIAEKVWGLQFDTGTNTIEVYINFLRNKVDKPFGQKLIHTRPGFGYMLKEAAE